MKYTIRTYQESDQSRIVSLISAVMNEEYHDVKHVYPLDDIQKLSQIYGGEKDRFYVAETPNRIIGTVGLKCEDDHTALLRRLFVEKGSRKQHVGTQLVASAVSFAKSNSYDEIVFKATGSMTAAIQLLLRCGFETKSQIQLNSLELITLSMGLRSEVKKSSSERNRL